jgi:hypothetical protein
VNRPLSLALLALAALAIALGACSPASPASAPEAPRVAKIRRTQCGRCHSPPEPGAHSRAEVEAAATRHSSRVRLTQEEWTAMIDYLAPSAN